MGRGQGRGTGRGPAPDRHPPRRRRHHGRGTAPDPDRAGGAVGRRGPGDAHRLSRRLFPTGRRQDVARAAVA
ncbi:hypothetical protein SGPA1_12476 [Streptomyces misionensis JCM 4497]